MAKYITFLRAINVGGRNIKMDQLRQLFEAMGFAHVETFIASGNVIFEADVIDRRKLEQQIETGLQDALGYRVDAFVRTIDELTVINEYKPFPDEELADNVLYIGFVGQSPSAESAQAVQEFTSDIDLFHIQGSEIYWLCRKTISQSKFSGAKLEKALGTPATLRNARTIMRLVSKYRT